MISAPANPEIGKWYVLHAKSRQEKRLAEALEAMQITYYLPLVKQVQYYGRRKAVVDMPLFPGYMFLRGSLENAYQADRTKRIVKIIPVPDQQEIDRQIKNIGLALANKVVLDPYPYLKKGIHVVVRSGPFKGLQGVIESRARNDRLVLQVATLSKAASLEIDGSLLEPIK